MNPLRSWSARILPYTWSNSGVLANRWASNLVRLALTEKLDGQEGWSSFKRNLSDKAPSGWCLISYKPVGKSHQCQLCQNRFHLLPPSRKCVDSGCLQQQSQHELRLLLQMAVTMGQKVSSPSEIGRLWDHRYGLCGLEWMSNSSQPLQGCKFQSCDLLLQGEPAASISSKVQSDIHCNGVLQRSSKLGYYQHWDEYNSVILCVQSYNCGYLQRPRCRYLVFKGGQRCIQCACPSSRVCQQDPAWLRSAAHLHQTKCCPQYWLDLLTQ